MPTPSRKLFYLFDWPLFINVLLLLLLGLFNLFSATATASGGISPIFKSQLLWVPFALSVLLISLTFHYRRLLSLALPFYCLSLFLLALVIFFGTKAGGQQNWLALGSFRIQPSEPAKVAVILMLARHFSCHPLEKGQGMRALFKPLMILALPLALILVERDLGSAIFFVLIGFSFFFLAGLSKKILLSALVLLIFVGGVGYRYFLSAYQKGRIESFLHPEQDHRGRGYHLFQSKVAVGSGHWTGKGYMEGTLHKFKFLPERHTDFVFPVLAEEWGFMGSMVTLFLFASFFLLLLQAAGKVQDPFGAYLIAGTGAWLFWQVFLNLGGVLGLLPLAGVTLPFLSYGGSSLITIFLALGLVLNVHMRRYIF